MQTTLVHRSEIVDTDNPEEDDAGKVRLSYRNARNQKIVLMLRIPHDVLIRLSTRPRKWLCYAAYTICGVVGTLFLCDEGGELSNVDLEGDVNQNDHFVYHFNDPPNFVDPQARGPKRSSPSVSTRSRERNSELRGYYGGCPFTRIPDEGGCHCCHLIPHSKGDDVSTYMHANYIRPTLLFQYLAKILRSRGDSIAMDIDDPRNMILLNTLLHSYFDVVRSIAFMRVGETFLSIPCS